MVRGVVWESDFVGQHVQLFQSTVNVVVLPDIHFICVEQRRRMTGVLANDVIFRKRPNEKYAYFEVVRNICQAFNWPNFNQVGGIVQQITDVLL